MKLIELLLARGLAEDEREARALIMAGRVTVGGTLADKPGTPVTEDAAVEVKDPRRKYASRGGEKLAAALAAFPVSITGRVCIDVGASTGGFSSCLLEHGAARVYAVDVGKGLLAWELRNDPRVAVMEGVNARYLDARELDPAPTLLVADVSFISLKTAVGKLLGTSVEIKDAIVLIKPQFEAPRDDVEPGGVVPRPEVVSAAVRGVVVLFARTGFGARGFIESPARGPAGNRELLLWAERGAANVVTIEEIDAVILAG